MLSYKCFPDTPDDIPEYNAVCDDFGGEGDDDLDDTEAIQALSNAEKALDEKCKIKACRI